MIDSTITSPSEIPMHVREANQARALQHWPEWLRILRGVTEALNAASQCVDKSWFELTSSYRSELIQARNQIVKLMNDYRDWKNARSPLANLWSGASLAAYSIVHRDIVDLAVERGGEFGTALARYCAAVDNAINKETARRKAMDESFATDQEIQASRERAENDLKEGRTTERITYKDFLNRSSI